MSDSLDVQCLSEVTPEEVKWLWRGYLPLGKLVTLDGDPGLGKSTLATAFAAVVTTGGEWPDGTQCEHSGDVVLLSAEDGLADTVRPRLDAAGADVSRVHAVRGVRIPGTEELRMPTLSDVSELSKLVAEKEARLLIIDVLMAYLPNGTDSHKDQDVRRVLSGLARLADDNDCTVLVLRHLNKAKGGDPLYRGGGSIGIVGAARAGLLVAPDRNDEDVRVLASIKSNLGRAPKSRKYRLDSASETGAAHVVWLGEATASAADLLEDVPPPRHNKVEEAKKWLREHLAENGRSLSEDVKEAAKKRDIAERTLKRAARDLGVQVDSEGSQTEDGRPRRVTYWLLPDGANEEDEDPGPPDDGPTDPTGDDQGQQLGPTTRAGRSGQPQDGGPNVNSNGQTYAEASA